MRLRSRKHGGLRRQLEGQLGSQLVAQLTHQLRDATWHPWWYQDPLWTWMEDQLWDPLWYQLGKELP